MPPFNVATWIQNTKDTEEFHVKILVIPFIQLPSWYSHEHHYRDIWSYSVMTTFSSLFFSFLLILVVWQCHACIYYILITYLYPLLSPSNPCHTPIPNMTFSRFMTFGSICEPFTSIRAILVGFELFVGISWGSSVDTQLKVIISPQDLWVSNSSAVKLESPWALPLSMPDYCQVHSCTFPVQAFATTVYAWL